MCVGAGGDEDEAGDRGQVPEPEPAGDQQAGDRQQTGTTTHVQGEVLIE